MLTIGGAAGAASFTQVHNVAAAHGQPGWLAWADAIVIELMSIASGLELRRRRRAHVSVRFPSVVLGCAVTLSLAAQVVEAEQSPIGWIAAAVPALGFLVMVKVALGSTSSTLANLGSQASSTGSPASPSAASADLPAPLSASPAEPRTLLSAVDPVGERTAVRRGPSAESLLLAAEQIRDQLAAQRRPVTREALAHGLRRSGHTVSNTRVSQLLKALKAPPDTELSTPDLEALAQPSGDTRS